MNATPPSVAPAAHTYRGPDRRDPRVDMLRGLSLVMVFINHIPFNALTYLTIRPFGFSDAAEIFVFLSGYSAWMAYSGIVVREGWGVALGRLGRRCVTIWGVHALLLLATVLLVLIRYRLTGRLSADLEPLLDDGVAGLLRGLTFAALPAYLDILPLYVVLLAAFPIVMIGLRRNMAATLLAAIALNAAAAMQDWNLPNVIDPRSAATVWTFNPLTWQLVFVLGAAMAEGRCRGWRYLADGHRTLRLLCLAVLIYAFLAVNPFQLWPNFAASLAPSQALDDVWKTNEAPWRLVNALAFLYLVLTTEACKRAGRLMLGRAFLACGRHSLPIFAVGCMLSLMGRFAYADFGIRPVVQLGVNAIGIGAQVGLAFWLDHRLVMRREARSVGWAGRERRA